MIVKYCPGLAQVSTYLIIIKNTVDIRTFAGSWAARTYAGRAGLHVQWAARASRMEVWKWKYLSGCRWRCKPLSMPWCVRAPGVQYTQRPASPHYPCIPAPLHPRVHSTEIWKVTSLIAGQGNTRTEIGKHKHWNINTGTCSTWRYTVHEGTIV